MHTKIPREEIEVFKMLKGLNVIFDVGARADVDYLEIYPDAEHHLFEPNADFVRELRGLVGDRKNVHINEFGLGDVECEMGYSDAYQAFLAGEAPVTGANKTYKIKTLDWYVKEKNISHIDFLKIDVEGYDFKVLLGGKSIIPNCSFIQYEHWDQKSQYHELLGVDFDMEYIGYRNVLCMNKRLVDWKDRVLLKIFILENKFNELV